MQSHLRCYGAWPRASRVQANVWRGGPNGSSARRPSQPAPRLGPITDWANEPQDLGAGTNARARCGPSKTATARMCFRAVDAGARCTEGAYCPFSAVGFVVLRRTCGILTGKHLTRRKRDCDRLSARTVVFDLSRPLCHKP